VVQRETARGRRAPTAYWSQLGPDQVARPAVGRALDGALVQLGPPSLIAGQTATVDTRSGAWLRTADGSLAWSDRTDSTLGRCPRPRAADMRPAFLRVFNGFDVRRPWIAR
jgi:hypothetical protein